MRALLALTMLLGVSVCGPGRPETLESAGGDGDGDEPQEPTRILFVGNSYTYNNDVPSMVESMAAAASIPVEIESVTGSGFLLVRHLEQPDLALMLDQGFDVVVLQGHYFEPFRNYGLFEGAMLDIIEMSQGARIVLYQTWPHRADAEELIEIGMTPEQMWEALEQGYASAAEVSGSEIAPVGAAWVEALNIEPPINLYANDGFHPSPAGSFLATCVLFGTLFDAPSVGNGWSWTAVPSDDDARLRTIADATNAAYEDP